MSKKKTMEASLCFKEQVMEKLREVMIKKFASTQPLKPLSSKINNHIEQFLLNFISNSHTPDHPTYASMIHRAIVELNEEGGSTEEAISKFIKAEQKDLPFAHSSLLSYHIKKICERGEIVCTSNMCYMLPVVELKQHKQKRRRGHCMGKRKQSKKHKNEVIKEQNGAQEFRIEDIESQNQLQEQQVGRIGEEQQIEVIDEQNPKEELEIEVIGGHAQEHGLQLKETEEQKQVEEQQFEVINKQNGAQGHEIECHNQSQEQGKLVGEQRQELAAAAEEQWSEILEGQSQAHWQRVEGVEDQTQTEEQEAELIKELNQLEEQRIKLQEIEIEVVEEHIKSQGQQNELIENQNEPQEQKIEGWSKVNDLRNMLKLMLEKQDEAGAAMTDLGSLTSQNLNNVCSFVSLKEICVKLLRSTVTFQYQLAKFMDSLSETEGSNHNTLKPLMDEEKENEQQQNLSVERPTELESTTVMQPCQTQQQTQGPLQPEPSSTRASSTLDHQNHEQPQAQIQHHEKLPKLKPPTATMGEASMPSPEQPHGQGQGRSCKPKPAASTDTEALLSSQQQKLEQGSISRGRGRPPKRKFDADATEGDLLIILNPQQQPKRRGRGRPPKAE